MEARVGHATVMGASFENQRTGPRDAQPKRSAAGQYSSTMPTKARSTRAKTNINKGPSLKNSSTPRKSVRRPKRAASTSPSENGSVSSGPKDADDGVSDTYQEEEDDDDGDDDVKSLHSDALDDDSDQETKKHTRKRKRASPVKPRRTKGTSPRKRGKRAAREGEGEGEEYDLKDGQQIVGKVVEAPKKGRGQCSLPLSTDTRSYTNLSPPQSLPVRYPKTRSTSFRNSQSRNATTVYGEDVP